MAQKTHAIRKFSFDQPDEVRQFTHGRMAIIQHGDATIGRAIFEPGWRWSTCVKPIAGTASCETAHLGYMIAGRLRVRMDDGTELEAGPGDLVEIAPGHDAWVVGNERVEFLELAGAKGYSAGKRAPGTVTMLPDDTR